MFARRLTFSAETDSPVGFEYLGTIQMPLMAGSSATRRSTASMSGPAPVIGTVMSS
jgi:hypothetical protein